MHKVYSLKIKILGYAHHTPQICITSSIPSPRFCRCYCVMSLTLLSNQLLLYYLCEYIQITLYHHQQSFPSSQRFKVESPKTTLLSISLPPGSFETNLTEHSGTKSMYPDSQRCGFNLIPSFLSLTLQRQILPHSASP